MSAQTGFLVMVGAWFVSGGIIGIMCLYKW